MITERVGLRPAGAHGIRVSAQVRPPIGQKTGGEAGADRGDGSALCKMMDAVAAVALEK